METHRKANNVKVEERRKVSGCKRSCCLHAREAWVASSRNWAVGSIDALKPLVRLESVGVSCLQFCLVCLGAGFSAGPGAVNLVWWTWAVRHSGPGPGFRRGTRTGTGTRFGCSNFWLEQNAEAILVSQDTFLSMKEARLVKPILDGRNNVKRAKHGPSIHGRKMEFVEKVVTLKWDQLTWTCRQLRRHWVVTGSAGHGVANGVEHMAVVSGGWRGTVN